LSGLVSPALLDSWYLHVFAGCCGGGQFFAAQACSANFLASSSATLRASPRWRSKKTTVCFTEASQSILGSSLAQWHSPEDSCVEVHFSVVGSKVVVPSIFLSKYPQVLLPWHLKLAQLSAASNLAACSASWYAKSAVSFGLEVADWCGELLQSMGPPFGGPEYIFHYFPAYAAFSHLSCTGLQILRKGSNYMRRPSPSRRVYEDIESGTTRLAYDLPPSLMSVLKNDEVTVAARLLDAKLIALARLVMGTEAWTEASRNYVGRYRDAEIDISWRIRLKVS
jgi:hypothetical protein